MLAAYAKLKDAQKVKKILVKAKVLHPDYLVVKELDHIFFPITKKIKSVQITNTKFKFPKKPTAISLKDLLKKDLTKKELNLIPRSQEIVGNILILEIPEEIIKKEKIIAKAYLEYNRNITTVVKKQAIHSGLYRTRKVKILAGKKTKETVHHENGVKIKLHLEKTYFSARSANERLRIAKKVKKGEEVLVMFSGAAPFPLVIAKNSEVKKVYGVELNPLAHQYALQNVELNKFSNLIKIYQGDVRTILPKIRKKFDRIVMPLPKTSEQFLGLALKKAKIDTIIHLYTFASEEDFPKEAKNLRRICQENGRRVRVLNKVKCGQFSPNVFRVCFDLKIIN